VAALKAPFPWFGGKRKVAPLVWEALGDVDNYVEPFAGSLAVLLGRPEGFDRWQTGAETVNDMDCYLVNFWRALSADPEAVAHYADWPVTETDLTARHYWLVTKGHERIAKIEADPDFYDAKVAGWWVWGISSWIGGHWCDGKGPWVVENGKFVKRTGSGGISRRLPHLGDAGKGIKRQMESLTSYLGALADRLRRVRVCQGDWSRVVTTGALDYGAKVGVFLDPPYLGGVRDENIYRNDDHHVSHAVRDWAIANGDNPRYRIVLAGYADEHAANMPPDWTVHAYSAGSSYNTAKGVGGNGANRHKERLWFSPHCLREAMPLDMLS